MTEIEENIPSILQELKDAGYSDGRIIKIRCGLNVISDYFYSKSLSYSDEELKLFLSSERHKHENGKLSLGVFQTRRKAAQFLSDSFNGRTISFAALPKWEETCPINEEFQNLLDNFASVERKENTPSRFRDRMRLIKRLMVFWEKRNICEIRKIAAQDILDFISALSESYAGSMGNLLAHIRAFGKYLNDSSFECADFLPAVSFRVSKRRKLQYAFSNEEISMLLDAADHDDPIDRRNHAMMVLAATTGMRSIDIVNLRICDIDFHKNEINIIQHKTGVPLTLPMVPECSRSIQRYMKEFRPDDKCGYVFLRHKVPCGNFADKGSLNNILKKYIKMAGLIFPEGTKTGFHCFRRHLGSELVKSGEELTMVTQILGHKDQQSAKAYLSFDTEQLKECCTSMAHIPMNRGEFL